MNNNFGSFDILCFSNEADSLINSFRFKHDLVLSHGFFSDDDISIMKEDLSNLYYILF